MASGKQIKAGRALLGLSQVDLAAKAGVHTNSVKYWEAREAIRDDGGAAAICAALQGQGVELIEGGARLAA